MDFDIAIRIGDIADAQSHQIDHPARKIVDAYIEHSVIVQNALDHPYEVGSVLVDESKMVRYRNALHEGYSDLNERELTSYLGAVAGYAQVSPLGPQAVVLTEASARAHEPMLRLLSASGVREKLSRR